MDEVQTLKELIIEAIKSKQYEKAESLFMEMVEKDEDKIALCEIIARGYHRIGQSKKFQDIAGIQFLHLLERKQFQKIYDLVKIYLPLVPDGLDFLEPLVTAVENLFSQTPNLNRFFRASGLKNGNNIKEELKAFEEFLFCDEGEVFEHQSWGIGVVKEINTLEKKVIIDFPNEKNKVMPFKGVYEYLKKIPHNHFKAMKIREPEKLKLMAKENPAEFVKYLLNCFEDSLKINEIKNLFLEILPGAEWNNWWKQAKDALRFDPQIDLKDGIQAVVKFRAQQKDFYDDLLEKIRETENFKKRCELARSILKHKNIQPPSYSQIDSLISLLKGEFEKYTGVDAGKQIQYYYIYNEVLQNLSGEFPVLHPTVEDILKSSDDLISLILSITSSEFQVETAKKIKEIFPEENWKKIFSEIFIQAPIKLASYIGETLLKNDGLDQLNYSAHKLFENYENNPETFIWMSRQILSGVWENVSTGVSQLDLTLEILHYLELLRHRLPSMVQNKIEYAKKLQSQIRAIFAERKFSIPLRVIQNPNVSAQEVRRLLNAIITSPAISSTVKNSITDYFREARKDIVFVEEIETKESTEQFLYATKESFEKKQKELEHILTVEIPKNSKEIGIAREKGDLRENAEYDAAKNRQALLMTQADELKGLLQKVRIIDLETINTDQIRIATRFTAKNLSKQKEETYTLLGIWDAKPEENILSYLSPFANQFMNKKIGDRFSLRHPDGNISEYEIVKIESAFA